MISDNTYIYNRNKIERIYKMMIKACAVNINNYNLNKMIHYSCKGYDLIGSTANTHDPRRHFLVKNNHYDVYEIPAKSNKGLRMTGTFLVLFYNTDFDIWIFAEMTHKFYKNKNHMIVEKVQFDCGGEYRISEDANKLHAKCITTGQKCCRGVRGKIFDSDNIRKELGYHTTLKVINKHFGITNIK